MAGGVTGFRFVSANVLTTHQGKSDAALLFSMCRVELAGICVLNTEVIFSIKNVLQVSWVCSSMRCRPRDTEIHFIAACALVIGISLSLFSFCSIAQLFSLTKFSSMASLPSFSSKLSSKVLRPSSPLASLASVLSLPSDAVLSAAIVLPFFHSRRGIALG